MIDWLVCDKTNHNKAVIASLFWGCGPHFQDEVWSFFLCLPTLPRSLEDGERLNMRGFNWYNEVTARQREARAGTVPTSS